MAEPVWTGSPGVQGDTGMFKEDQSVSSVPSSVSMRSDRSMGKPVNFSKEEPGPLEEDRAVSPVDSLASMESDRSMGEPVNFSKEEPGPLEEDRAVSPVDSLASMESDRSMGEPVNFSKEEPGPFVEDQSVSSVPGSVSMRSDRSMGKPVNFSKEEPGPLEEDRAVSPVDSLASMESDRSMGEPVNFSKEEPGPFVEDQSVSSVPGSVSMRSDRSMGKPVNFSKEEPGPLEEDRAVSPVDSLASMESDRSMGEPVNFSKEEPGPFVEDQSVSSVPGSVSMRSDRSMGKPVNFSKEEPGPLEEDRAVSPVDSLASMESDRSMGEPVNFSKEEPGPFVEDQSVSSVPGSVSMRSDRSMGKPVNFSKEEPGPLEEDRAVSPVDSLASMESDRSMGEPVNFSKEEPGVSMRSDRSMGKPVNFSKEEPGPFEEEKSDSPVPSSVSSQSDRSKSKTVNLSKEEPGPFEEEKSDSPVPSSVSLQSNRSKDEPVSYSKEEPRSPDQNPDTTTPSGENTLSKETLKQQQQLVSALRRRFLSENTEVENKDHPNHQNTEHIIREEKSNEVDNGEKYRPESVTRVKATSDIFKDTKEKTIRTVLTIGEAEIGKSFHVQKFKREWAENDKGSYLTWVFSSLTSFMSKADEEVIFPLNFSELNKIKEEKLSLVGLLEHFFKETKECVLSNFEQFKVLFVLDGLDDYEPPLDFDSCDILTDTRQPASVDVLLTNLIRGKLFPSARLWITSRPSAAKQLPDACVDRTTEIRWKDVKHKLKADLKRRILSQHIEVKKLEPDTELYNIRKEKQEAKAQTYDDLFHNSQKQKVRTVLMKGVPCVGKTLQTRRFMVDWAEDKSNKNIDFIVSLKFSELNSRKDKVESMTDLIHVSLNDDKHPQNFKFNKSKIAFVLDGLEECELPLDFKNNQDLTDMDKPASMDVLLTNLIKGKLLPSARLWIVSQPSGVHKIPSKYIQKQTECRGKDFTQELTADLKKTIRLQHEEELRKLETDTEVYKIGKDKEETYNTFFTDSGQKTVRTVLMKGVPRVGKTIQTRRFMVDWAKGQSNKNIDLIVSLKFSKLNSRKDKVQSMTNLIRHSLNDKHRLACHYNKHEVAFVLDGLEECELPLDFKNNQDLTDMDTPASMDVLLTNLIKGKLLPSARLWIVSQPSGVHKIPSEYIQKQTECRETLRRRQQLVSALRRRFLSENTGVENKDHPNQQNTEHIIREEKSNKVDNGEKNQRPVAKSVTQVKATSDIFKNIDEKPIRTVLTIGEAEIGKSFHAQKFKREWAENDKGSYLTWIFSSLTSFRSKADEEVIFPLNFSELNKIKEKKLSLVGLLEHFFKETKECVLSNFEQFKVLFVLDGLDDYEPPLDFDSCDILTDPREPASVDVLLTNLIRGKLFPSARLWITSRPSAAKQLPDACVDRTTEIRCKAVNPKLTEDLKRRILSQHEEEVKEHEADTELYEIRKEKQEEKTQTYDELFQISRAEKVRTVLMTGVPGVGKTLQSRRFMVDWAKGNSNKNINLIVSLKFSELNSRKEQSMRDLFCHSLSDDKHAEVCRFDDWNIAFVLDGLEECELPLDFENNQDLTDMDKPASMDVLLTNLIKGKLLPCTHLWIVSQPSGVHKIPSKYIQKQTECRGKDFTQELTADLKKTICHQHEEELRKLKTDTEVYKIGKDKEETYNNFFTDSGQKTVRTVLMKGVPRVGKTIQTSRFMVDWAKGQSNKDIDLIVSLKFSKLNSRKDKVQSMTDLIRHSLNDKHRLACHYNKHEVAFVLDGLEECELPLDFKNNQDLTDMDTPASMDVLLTNLIKGKLLPSAHLWIVSQPSGVHKIPSEYIQKQTECRGKDFTQELTADLKETICHQHEEELRKLKTDTEVYKIGKDKEETYNTFFTDSGQKTVQTVLMTGVPRVGKTIQTSRFMVDWAKGQSNKNIDLIVSLKFSELNSRKDKVQSMTDLIRHSLNDKHRLACHYNKHEVAFVLDGLEECELPLDFENNQDLTDMDTPALMDVLLTNLIKGKLLPSARLWIVSQPSGVHKIPSEYIQKQTECRGKDFTQELTADLKKTIRLQHEEELRKLKTDTELYEIGEEHKVQTFNELFKDKEVRTVLMKEVPHDGKTIQTRRFMVDWAEGKTNKNIDLIVSLKFSELNSRKDKVESMTDLIHVSLNDDKHPQNFKFNKSKIAFVLDGLEECELPLDFENNQDLTDMDTPASMDVLLTNLIKGKLLPSARLWIVSQPSGVDKIPSEYIQRWIECRGKDFTQELTADLKETICHQHQEELSECETDTELFEIGEEHKAQTCNELFKDKKVRTVLMKGVPRVGKTLQTSRFMVDWAEGQSNKNIDLIVSLKFSELNSRKDEVQSMTDLIRHSLNDRKHRLACRYNSCQVAFVLDGLEECELPLDFKNSEDLTEMYKPASMDVLLTNLIKGKLLPSARLWIVSQPSGVHKIPSEYIQKQTECRETLRRRQQLVSVLRRRFLSENTGVENKDHPNQQNTEHIIREEKSNKVDNGEKNQRPVAKSVTQVKATSDIFKNIDEKPIRTVLTIGEAEIGKSFHAQKFKREWAENDKSPSLTWDKSLWSKADEEVIFPLNFSELNEIKEEKVSLVGLLERFFKETKECVVSKYKQFKVLFVLDGLDDYHHPLDFDNSNILTDPRQPASVDVLLTNLIRGKLFPSARLWITSRPSAAKQLPDACVDRTTEIRCKPHIKSHQTLKTQLKEQFTHVSEGIDKQETSALLNEIYTDLYIIEGERGEVNEQHETKQVQDAKFKPESQETLIKYQDIFKPASGDNRPIRTVLTIGVAGIGKSFATMKYMLDWAEGSANEDIYYMFPLSFRELNLKKEETLSMEELIGVFFPGMKTSEITDYDKYRILIVLDGFDECRLDLDFSTSTSHTDVGEAASVNVLLTNLIQGNLFSKAQIWITSRPAASNRIPSSTVDRVTEVRGFSDDQKEEYFRKRFTDKELAEEVLSHVKKSRSIYIMCHIPVFCWITSKVLEDFVNREQKGMMPKALTDMYIYFLLLQCRQANVKYAGDDTGESAETDSCWNQKNQETIISLGKLAFESLEEGNLLFTEEDLTACGLDITEAAVFSGLFTQIKREGCGVSEQKLFCFVHLSIQEFLAAFYVSHTFNNKGENLLTEPPSKVADLDFYKTAVDKALASKHGDWDLSLRFLLGLSLETNQKLLQELLKEKENNKKINKETIDYIKGKIKEENSDADKKFNLFQCLNELNDQSLVKEVKKCLRSETVGFEHFSTAEWSALTYVLLTSDEKLDVFDLKKYLKSEKVLLGMLPVVRFSNTALLSWCELSEESCRGLTSSVLSSASSNLTVLDLSHNDLLDSGVEKLADGLKSLHCKLEVLKLSGCQVSENGCSFLAEALESKTTCSLKQLDLSYNHPGVNGVTTLSATAPYRNMSLQICFDHSGEHRLKPGLRKYGADLKFDENTASKRLVLSEGNRTVKTIKKVEEKVTRPENEGRFKRSQVFCEEGLKGLCYWEVEWKGEVGIAVAYSRVSRRWDSSGGLGCNDKSWSLLCLKKGWLPLHGKQKGKPKYIEVPQCKKIALLLDWEGGTLKYYSVTSGELSLIHTFKAKFTEPLFPGFWFKNGSVTLCEID
ncbi:uncharacterized protein AB9X84_011658 isoform 2-T2 [Acanthopagrus schlegelii]